MGTDLRNPGFLGLSTHTQTHTDTYTRSYTHTHTTHTLMLILMGTHVHAPTNSNLIKWTQRNAQEVHSNTPPPPHTHTHTHTRACHERSSHPLCARLLPCPQVHIPDGPVCARLTSLTTQRWPYTHTLTHRKAHTLLNYSTARFKRTLKRADPKWPPHHRALSREWLSSSRSKEAQVCHLNASHRSLLI